MSKPNKNKHRCDKYKSSGAHEINKQLKQERHQKRMARFEKRHEEGKTYEYKPNPFKKGTKKWHHEAEDRAAKNADKRTPQAQRDSNMRLLQNELDKEIAERKKTEDAKKRK